MMRSLDQPVVQSEATRARETVPETRDGARKVCERTGTVPAGTVMDGRYRIQREIARGGMCVVYCATHEFTGRKVALKVLRNEFANDRRARARLLREARLLERCRCEQVVDLLDAGELDDGAPYVVMKMLEGRPLDGILASRRTLTVPDTVELGVQLCDALTSIHATGVVHRDIKPGNVVMEPVGEGGTRATLLDFGVAVLRNAAKGGATAGPVSRITAAGEFFGTPEYVAPETVRNPDELDTRSDIFSLGVTLYECLTGEVPHTGTFGEVFVRVLMAGEAPDVRAKRPEVAAPVALALARAMAPLPDNRFSSGAELRDSLRAAAKAARDVEAASARQEQAQRRLFPRVAYVTPVSIVIGEDTRILGRSEDISEGGMLVIADRKCEANSVARVTFVTPIRGQLGSSNAVVRWVRAARDKTAMGLQFEELPGSVRDEIAVFVGRNKASG